MAQGFRPTQLKVMREMASNLRAVIASWSSPPSTFFYDAGDGRGMTSHRVHRERKDIPASEYPENNPEELRRLIQFMVAIRRAADLVLVNAHAQLNQLEGNRPQ